MSLTEADTWLKGFTAWFEWNASILISKDPLTKRVLLENFIDERLLSKLQTDASIRMKTAVLGHGGVIDKLRSYYVDDCPLICRRHAFTTCRQEHGEPFLTWWERKMIKAKEGMIDSMTADNWLELELIRGVNDRNLQKRTLQEHNPMLRDMVSIATLWQSAETAMAQFIPNNETSVTYSEPEEINDPYYERLFTWSNNNLSYPRDQTEREDHSQKKNGKRGKDHIPMDTSTSGHTRRVRVKNHMSRQLLDWQHTMHNVKITPVNSGYQLKFSQFSSDVYPDTGCMETIIAASMTKCKKLSIFPINRQFQCREGR